MRPFQICSYFFASILFLTSCAQYEFAAIEKYEIRQSYDVTESENYLQNYSYYVHNDSTIFKLTSPQFYNLEDSVSISGILNQVKKDIISDNLNELGSNKILDTNKYNRVHYFMMNDSLEFSDRSIVTLTDANIEKIRIYKEMNIHDHRGNQRGQPQDSLNPGKIGLIIVVGSAIVGLVTYIMVATSIKDFSW